ncbi:MAG TPA: imidazole glycerol phosphate synthase subunit HisH [Bryobacteraceae bacterium]|jgi:imidazole glycerol phosphate synthase glutamine amidotransferase subunit|nr:imidazole glycerol phosphate synthase subunit HisH [Bryobacteraceae bacterium]
MIAIIDYGAGNLRSVQNTLDEIGAPYQVLNRPDGIDRASKLILPGVGHFGQMMRALETRGLREPVLDRIRAGLPFLGICLGLQALYAESEEAPGVGGFGLFCGAVRRFPPEARVPHMGWNELERRGDSRLLAGLGERPYVYFAHSYYVPEGPATAAVSTYTNPYTAILEHHNIFGVQFHPEKSGPVGLKIVKNFLEL